MYGDLSNPHLRVVRLAQPSALGDADLGPQVPTLSTFGQDASGRLYAADWADGFVYRLGSDGNATTNPACPAAPGGPGGGSGSGGGGSGSADKTAPVITLRLARRVRILRRRAISVKVSVNERSTVTGTATVNVGHAARVLRFKRVTRTLAARRQVTVKLRPSKRTLALLRRALRRKRSFLARVTFSARDAADNVRTKRRSVRLVR
jgi:hypothetical protein